MRYSGIHFVIRFKLNLSKKINFDGRVIDKICDFKLVVH